MSFKHVVHSLPLLEKVTLEDGQRTYLTPNGKRYPSVTTVIKGHSKVGIDAWKARVGEKKAAGISKNASDRDNAVHEFVEALLNNYPTQDFLSGMLPHAKAVYFNMAKELTNCVTEVHGIEQPLFSHKLRLAGTADLICRYDGLLTILDNKTALRLKQPKYVQGYYMQLVAYAFMFQELTGLSIDQGVILIGVDNETKAQVFKLPRRDFSPHLKNLISWRDKYEQELNVA